MPLTETVDVDGVAALRARGDLQGIDANIVPSEGRRKQLLIADMDSTIITSESLDDIARLAGIADDILPITTRAMRGELDFEQALDARLALFAGKPASLVDEALAEVNRSTFGLQAGIFTRDLFKMFDAWDRLEVGGVVINDVPSYRVDNMPYGGVKDSGLGREGIKFAMEDMTEIRNLVIRRG